MFGGNFGGGPFAGLRGFMGPGMMEDGRFAARPEHYDEFFKAYSMAMLPGKERAQVSYGGKIMMPPSALARLSELLRNNTAVDILADIAFVAQMEIESPWLFELSNTGVNLADHKVTHAGVLEFIAEEGHVHLPAWMMRALRLSEGDPIRLRGKTLPKGKLVKIEPQTVDFLEISDPKAVLEAALSNFSTLTKGDIIEFSYNCLTFEILILEIQPDAEGISIIDTDLEVDFAPPKGYVEPKRQPKAAPQTMASKLNIDTERYDSISASGTSTPRSNDGSILPMAGLTAGAANSAANGNSEAASVAKLPFQGQGHSLSGKKPKGKKDKPIEAPDKFSMIRRTDQPRIVTNDTQLGEKKVPAALNLPFGKLFFGYDVVKISSQQDADEAKPQATAFSGSGQTMSGRAPRSKPSVSSSSTAKKSTSEGQTLGGSRRSKDSNNMDDDDD